MSVRGTRTGAVLEQTILPVLRAGGYGVACQVRIGKRPGGGTHFVDAVVSRGERRFLVSLKWQQVSGTAEQKVPFEVICLADAVAGGSFDCAYLVLGGEGWKLREFYVSGELRRYMPTTDRVEVVTLERFITLANRNEL